MHFFTVWRLPGAHVHAPTVHEFGKSPWDKQQSPVVSTPPVIVQRLIPPVLELVVELVVPEPEVDVVALVDVVAVVPVAELVVPAVVEVPVVVPVPVPDVVVPPPAPPLLLLQAPARSTTVQDPAPIKQRKEKGKRMVDMFTSRTLFVIFVNLNEERNDSAPGSTVCTTRQPFLLRATGTRSASPPT